MMDELLNSKCENPSERISAWIKEIKTYGFHSLAFESNTIDTINNENTKSENENEVEGFVVQDLFCKIHESEVVKYEREDGLDANAGLTGDCSVFLENGYELNGSWRNGKRHGRGLICGPPLEAKGIKVIWGKYSGRLIQCDFINLKYQI